MSALPARPTPPVYRWWEDSPYRRPDLGAETADAIAADNVADPCPTVADIAGHFARHGVGIDAAEAHWHLHHLEFIRSTLARRFAFDAAVLRAELARYGVGNYLHYRAAKAQERAGGR